MNTRSMKILFVVALVAAVATPLFAHLKILKTVPATDSTIATSPKQVEVWFDEAPDLKVSKMTLMGPAGAVKLGAPQVKDKSLFAAVQGNLADGAYTTSWTSEGDDGHVQTGMFKFTVKSAQ